MPRIFRSILGGSAIIVFEKTVSRALSLVALWVVTQGLSRTDYGVVVLALSVSGPVLVLGGLGLDESVLAAGARLRGKGQAEDAARLFSGFAFMKLTVSAVVIVSLFWVKNLLGETYRPVLEGFLLPLQVWIALTAVRTLQDTALQMQERFAWSSFGLVLETFGKLAVLAVLFFQHTVFVPTVIWAYVAGKALAALVTAPALFAFVPRYGIASSLRSLRDFVRGQGKWEVVRMSVGSFFSGLDQWIIGIFASLEAVAIYSLASTMRSVIQQLLPFRQILFPMLARMSRERHATSFVARKMAKYGIWLNTLIILVAIALVPPVVRILFPDYLLAIPVFYALLPTLLLNAAGMGQTPVLLALGEQRYQFGLSMLSTVSGLTLLPLLTWRFGIFGAVGEQILSTAAMVVMRERRLAKRGVRTFSPMDVAIVDDFDRSTYRRVFETLRSIPRRLTQRL